VAASRFKALRQSDRRRRTLRRWREEQIREAGSEMVQVPVLHWGQPYKRNMRNGQLLDVVPGRSGAAPTVWLLAQGQEWLAHVRHATLVLSGPYRSVFDNTVPHTTQRATSRAVAS
jgi:hypothetical protein